MKKFCLIFALIIITGSFLFSDVIKDSVVRAHDYVRLNSFENINIWTIASLDKPPLISEIYIDSKKRFHIAYYDSKIRQPVYVFGTGSKYTKLVIDKKIGRGRGIALGIDPNAFVAHTAYIDQNTGSLFYANNAAHQFDVYPVDMRDSGFRNINIVVSAFRDPIMFFLNKAGHVYLSRFYQGSFFTDAVYTKKSISNIKAFSEPDGYMLFLQEKESGNIFYASRKTNTAFTFYENAPFVKNALLYTVFRESHNSFAIAYVQKSSPNTLKLYRYFEGNKKDIVLAEMSSPIEAIDIDVRYTIGLTALFRTKENTLYLFVDERVINLSDLGKVQGDISIRMLKYPYFSFVYYHEFTKELKIALINLIDIQNWLKK